MLLGIVFVGSEFCGFDCWLSVGFRFVRFFVLLLVLDFC